MGLPEEVQAILDKATSAPDGPAGIVFAAVDRTGKVLANQASGVKSLATGEKLKPDSVFALYSTTKILATIAILQLVEKGLLKLDEPLSNVLPELAGVQVYDESGKLVPQKGQITLRQLLTHTAGFSYTFFNENIKKWSEENGVDEFAGKRAGFNQPLIHQPGTNWKYGVNIDWAGFALEKVTGKTLGQYSAENIFGPLGAKEISYALQPNQVDRFVSMHQRGPDGKLRVRDHLPYVTDSEVDSGGAGAFGTGADYLKVIVPLINEGKGANGVQILKPETVKSMYEDQIPELSAAGALDAPIAAITPELTYPIEVMPGVRKGWGLSWLITKDPLPTGRSPNSAWWAGLPNLYYTADPHKGVANIILTQSFPFNDPKVAVAWLDAEKALYDSLA